MFGHIEPPSWGDKDLYIVGGGDSIKGLDLSHLQSKGRVLGLNKAHEFIPCDAVFSIDHAFIRNYAQQLEQWAAAGSEVYLAPGVDWFTQNRPIPGCRYIKRLPGKGISSEPHTVINGLNTGYSAICLAVLKGAKRIFLLGYDMRGANNHWHDGYGWCNGRTMIYFPRWAARFQEIADALPEGVRVLNCNPESGIRAFPFTTYEQIGL